MRRYPYLRTKFFAAFYAAAAVAAIRRKVTL